MGQVRVGTVSWTGRTLIASGWYPPEADTPEKWLRYYARQFPLVEVDDTYYALPAAATAQVWVAPTHSILDRLGMRRPRSSRGGEDTHYFSGRCTGQSSRARIGVAEGFRADP